MVAGEGGKGGGGAGSPNPQVKGGSADRISMVLAFVGLLLPPAWWLAVVFGIVATARSGGRRWWGLGCCLASLVVAVLIRVALLR